MFRSALLLAAAATVVLTSLVGDANARGVHRMRILDDKGDVLFDDGKLDGKGCVVGKQAVFDQKTGGIKVVNAAKCNSDRGWLTAPGSLVHPTEPAP
ncbi:MAG: hypothetical protein ACXW3R_05985 [Rhodoplanes sp.]